MIVLESGLRCSSSRSCARRRRRRWFESLCCARALCQCFVGDSGGGDLPVLELVSAAKGNEQACERKSLDLPVVRAAHGKQSDLRRQWQWNLRAT